MFIGHYAVGFAAKRAAPQVSLGWLMAAPLLLDLLWPLFLLAGWEQVRIEPGNTAFTPLAFVHYPISHSLVVAVGWAVLFGVLWWARTRQTRAALVIGLAVVSHWFLDAVVHRPDLPLYPGSSVLVGLGLWNSIPGTIGLETLLFAAGVWCYLSVTRPRDRVGRWGLWSFVAGMLLLYAGNLAGPPPPSVRVLAAVGLAAWALPLLAAWLDRRREPTPTAP